MGGGWALIRGERLITVSAFRMNTYSRSALIRGWAVIRINTVYVLPVTCLDDQYCGCTPRRHDKSQRKQIQCANNPVTQSCDCCVCLSICSVFPLRRVLKSQQCLHTAGRDKICILYRQLPFALGGPVGVKFLQAI